MEEERREGEGNMGVRRGGRRKVKSDEMREGVLENPLEEGEGIEAIAGGGEEDKMKREEEIHGRKRSERRGRLGEEGETHTHSQEPERPKSHGGVSHPARLGALRPDATHPEGLHINERHGTLRTNNPDCPSFLQVLPSRGESVESRACASFYPAQSEGAFAISSDL